MAFRWCITHKADVIDDVTKQMLFIAFYGCFFGFRLRKWPPTTESLVWKWSQNMENLLVHKLKKCWFSTEKFSKLPLRISCLNITVMEQIVMFDNLRTFWGLEDFRLIIHWKDKKMEQLDKRQIIVKIPMFWFNLFMLVDGMNSDFKNFLIEISVWWRCGMSVVIVLTQKWVTWHIS